MQQRTVEQIGRAPVPQIIVIPKDRFSWCASSGVCHKREYHFVWSRKLHSLFTRHHVCPEFSWHDISGRTKFGWCPSGIGVNVWSHCQLFGLQSAHADGADEIDAPLDDVPSTGLNGVDRVTGASLFVKVVKTRRWRLRHMLATFAGILEEHRTGGAERAMVLTTSLRRSGDNGKDGGRGMRGIESERERFICPAFHFHPRSQHAMWSSPRSRARFNRACVRCPLVLLPGMLFLQHGCVNLEDRPLSSMAWTRAERAADSVSAAVCVSSAKQWLLIRSFMVSCVSPIAGRSSCDSVSGSESTTWCQDVISVNDCCRPHKYAAKGCGGTSR